MLQTVNDKPEKPTRQNTDPQVEAQSDRRRFTTAYKLSILAQADQCEGKGEIGALLRREGLYSSHLSNWRQLRREGTLSALTTKKRGPKPELTSAERRELQASRKRIARLEDELDKARTIIDVQKKLSRILSTLPEDESTS